MNALAIAPVMTNPPTPENPRDSWPKWTDQERWVLGPPPAPFLDPRSPAVRFPDCAVQLYPRELVEIEGGAL